MAVKLSVVACKLPLIPLDWRYPKLLPLDRVLEGAANENAKMFRQRPDHTKVRRNREVEIN